MFLRLRVFSSSTITKVLLIIIGRRMTNHFDVQSKTPNSKINYNGKLHVLTQARVLYAVNNSCVEEESLISMKSSSLLTNPNNWIAYY